MKALVILDDNNYWIKTYRAINTLLSYGVNILWTQESIKQSEILIKPGTFLIPLDALFKIWTNTDTLQSYKHLNKQDIINFLQNEDVKVEEIEIIKTINTLKLKPPRVALYQDSGCFNHALVISTSGFDVDWVTGMEVAAGALEDYDIFMSGGGGGATKANINRENLLLASMGVDGAKNVTKFVSEGGAYFGCCGGSYIASVVRERFMNWWHPAKKYMTMLNVEDWHINENSDSGFISPGQGTYIAKNTNPDNPAMFGVPELFQCVHWNGPIWNLIEAAVPKASSPKSLVAFEEVSPKKFTPSEFFKTNVVSDESQIKNTGIYKACELGKSAIAQGFYGLGLVFLSGSHPEMYIQYGSELSRDELWDSTRILSNATLWAASNNIKQKKSVKTKNNLVIPYRSYQEEYVKKINTIKEKTAMLKGLNLVSNTTWLDPNLYSLSYGLTPKEMYIQSLEEMPKLCDIILSEFKKLDELVQNSIEILNEIKTNLTKVDSENNIKALNILMERGLYIILRYFNMLGKQKEPIWYQKGNEQFQGLYSLINIALEKATNAVKRQEYILNNNVTVKELIDNPLVEISNSRIRMDNALKILWLNEAAFEKFSKLWELYNK